MNFEGQVTSSHSHTLLSQKLHILLVHTAEKEKVLCCMKSELIANKYISPHGLEGLNTMRYPGVSCSSWQLGGVT